MGANTWDPNYTLGVDFLDQEKKLWKFHGLTELIDAKGIDVA
jgi:hypothetical protein